MPRQTSPTLAAALHVDRIDHDRGADWQAACDRVGRDAPLVLGSTTVLASALRVAAVLAGAPRLTVSASQPVDAGATHPKLAKVRALLAKAESTPFDEEAELLSAKAQELITRYALDHLLQGGASSADGGQQMRRLWLDAPYIRAKADLVHVVAEANRCRSAFAASCDFSVVVGSAHDIEAVELLVTSLLVQADAAMVRHSRQSGGRARTRSFRQSFLLGYAARIGERLGRATQQAVDARGDGRLLPALLDHAARVEAAFDAMVPHRAATGPSIRAPKVGPRARSPPTWRGSTSTASSRAAGTRLPTPSPEIAPRTSWRPSSVVHRLRIGDGADGLRGRGWTSCQSHVDVVPATVLRLRGALDGRATRSRSPTRPTAFWGRPRWPRRAATPRRHFASTSRSHRSPTRRTPTCCASSPSSATTGRVGCGLAG